MGIRIVATSNAVAKSNRTHAGDASSVDIGGSVLRLGEIDFDDLNDAAPHFSIFCLS
jgi:hypothetical protein